MSVIGVEIGKFMSKRQAIGRQSVVGFCKIDPIVRDEPFYPPKIARGAVNPQTKRKKCVLGCV
jgi:hypothetical protein